jgi:hypothetical protein
MPVLTKKTKKTCDVVVGYKCDKCGDEYQFRNFGTKYNYGYGLTLDMSSVTFELCDTCFTNIILKEIPNALFERNGKKITVVKTENGFEESDA